MTYFAVITKVDDEGNYACGEILVNPDGEKWVVGSNLIVNPSKFDEALFAEALCDCHRDRSTIDLTKRQMLMCSVPVFTLGEIMVMGSNDRTVPDGRKPSKWRVEYECFDDIDDAIKRAKEVVGDS